MRIRKLTVVFAFLLGVIAGTAAVLSAQVDRARLPGRPETVMTITTDTAGRIISTSKAKTMLANADVGLRIVGQHDGRVVGTLVAKVDGRWVEVQLAPQDSLARR